MTGLIRRRKGRMKMDSNVILVFDREKKNILMCRRRKPPYQGLLNLVGGKVEPGEEREHAAYRELREETAITREDITLDNIVNFTYPHKSDGAEAYILECYAGVLKRDVDIRGDENELLWISADEDFTDSSRFAGVGNIAHMVKYALEEILTDRA